jgi:electron-transferring-flavoprotein dehydrogenase
MERESMHYDLVIVGAGPAGLSAAIRAAQLAKAQRSACSICVLEKGAEVGAHILSGAVFNPQALNELLPDWKNLNAPLEVPVTSDHFWLLTQKKKYTLPLPPQMHNSGNFIISLGQLCRFLAQQAESLGVEIYPGFAATEVISDENNRVIGVLTNDVGIDKTGQKKSTYQPGMALYAKQVLIAEGCRGSLAEKLIKKYALRSPEKPQTYAIGFKEIWEIPPTQHALGKVVHTLGWPLNHSTYGGSFIYHWKDNKVLLGFVIGLDYQNPYLSPYEEFQRFKHHPVIASLLQGGRCLSYGARALNEGGYQALPKLSFPGGLLLGCSAGFLNVPAIKGSHYAMKSGMLAAESFFSYRDMPELQPYETAIFESWIGKTLHAVRNIRPAFRYGLIPGLAYAALDTYVFKGKSAWTLKHHHDHTQLKSAAQSTPIDYLKPDGCLSFDKMTSVNRANTYHEENQPCHLKLLDSDKAMSVNYPTYAAPEQRYCPAGVYEYVEKEGHKQLQINAQNCIHCKTCDIKDPTQNIQWVPPEGSGGPNYGEM